MEVYPDMDITIHDIFYFLEFNLFTILSDLLHLHAVLQVRLLYSC